MKRETQEGKHEWWISIEIRPNREQIVNFVVRFDDFVQGLMIDCHDYNIAQSRLLL